MILTTKHAILASANGCAAIILTEARQCKLCKAMHFWFINRNGRTLCAACDGDQQRDLSLTRRNADG